MDKRYCIYILRCADGTLYCGISTSVGDRMAKHNEGKGAKYVRGGRLPANLAVATPHVYPASDAASIEYHVKHLKKDAKIPFLLRLGGRCVSDGYLFVGAKRDPGGHHED